MQIQLPRGNEPGGRRLQDAKRVTQFTQGKAYYSSMTHCSLQLSDTPYTVNEGAGLLSFVAIPSAASRLLSLSQQGLIEVAPAHH